MVTNKSNSIPIIGRRLGAIWGVLGVILLLSFAVYRLFPFVTELTREKLNILQVIILLIWLIIMGYSEGYKAFGKQFAPRVFARAQYLSEKASWLIIILAPLFCVGYFGASKKRIIASSALSAGIIVLIIIVHFVEQPWRGIIDSGVILGLAIGIIYLVVYAIRALRQSGYVADPEVK